MATINERQWQGRVLQWTSELLTRQGKAEIVPRRGGVMIYLPNEAPKSASTLGKEAFLLDL